jgi:hypothetical protein
VDTTIRGGRTECVDAVDALPIPRPFTLDRFADQLGEQRGRPIKLIPARLGATAPCGLLIGTDEIDLVFYAANTSTFHAHHIVMHEIGHLVLDHQSTRVVLGPDPSGVARARTAVVTQPDPLVELREKFTPDLAPQFIRTLLARTTYDAEEERRAELFAALAVSRIARQDAVPHHPSARELDLVRLQLVFDIPTARNGSRA